MIIQVHISVAILFYIFYHHFMLFVDIVHIFWRDLDMIGTSNWGVAMVMVMVMMKVKLLVVVVKMLAMVDHSDMVVYCVFRLNDSNQCVRGVNVIVVYCEWIGGGGLLFIFIRKTFMNTVYKIKVFQNGKMKLVYL